MTAKVVMGSRKYMMKRVAAKIDGIKHETGKDAVADFFSASTRYWEAIYEQNPDEIERVYSTDIVDRKKVVLQMLDQCTGEVPSMVLDVGCGPGVFMREVLERGHTVVGMDISDRMTREAKEAVKRYYNERAICVVGDIERLPFEDNTFDVILCIGVLSYVDNDASGIGEMTRVVRKNGSIILAVPNKWRMNVFFDPCYFWERGKAILWRRRGSASTAGGDEVMVRMRRYVPGQLASVFRPNNLRQVESRSLGYGPMTFWKREFAPAELSLKISRCLEGLARNRLLSFVNMFANHFIYCLQKVQESVADKEVTARMSIAMRGQNDEQ